MFKIHKTETGAQITHPKRAFTIRGAYHLNLNGEVVVEAETIEQVKFYGVYAYEGNKPEGEAWHMVDCYSYAEAMAYVQGFVRGMGQ